MKQRLDWFLRLIGTAIAFSTFGLGGIVLPIIVVPVLYLLPGTKRKKELRAKATIHYAFRGFVEWMRILGLLRYQIINPEAFNRSGQLILANHPTLIDVVFLIAFIKNADCVVKGKLFRNPFMMGSLKAAHYIANHNSADVLDLAKKSMERGNNLIVFPEGTRTTPGEALKMQRGAANIAMRCQCAVTPVVVRCDPSTLTKDLKWYQIPPRRIQISLEARPELDLHSFRDCEPPSLAARKFTRFLEIYFTQELDKVCPT